MSFYAQYPSSAGGNASVSTNNLPIPSDSTLVGGENPSGNLEPLQVDASGNLLVSLAAEPLNPFNTKDAADGTPGAVAPGTAIQIGGTDGTDLRAISTDNTGKVNINNISGTVSLPTGASTAANQATGNASLATIATNTTGVALDSHLTNVQSAPGTPQTVAVTIQGNASGVAVPTTVASLPLPSGAATSANQTNGSQKSQVVNSSGVSVDAKSLSTQVVSTDVGLVTNTVIHGLSTAGGGVYVDVKVNPSGTLAVDASGSTGLVLGAGTAIVGKVGIDQTTPGTTNGVQINAALPAGANTIGAVTQASGPWSQNITQVGGSSVTLGQKVMAASVPVVISSDQSAITTTPNPAKGRSLANAPVVTTYGTPITSSAYTTIVASTTSTINMVEIFDSSGVALYFAVGAAASEVNQFVIYPGGNGQVPITIPSGSRISYKAVSTSASGASAFNVLNMYT